MKSLFNGKDLTDWTAIAAVEREGWGDSRRNDGGKPGDGNTFIIWKGGTLKDFDLRLTFRCNATIIPGFNIARGISRTAA